MFKHFLYCACITLLFQSLAGQTPLPKKTSTSKQTPTSNQTPTLQQTPTPGFQINGHIEGVPDGTTVFVFDIDEKKTLDSTVTTAGKFTLKGQVTNPTTCWLKCKDEYAIIQLENTIMKVETPYTLMKVYARVTGGEEQTLLNELDSLQFKYNQLTFTAYDSLRNKQYKDDVHRKALESVLNDSQDSAQVIYVEFGKRHPASFLGMDILYRNRKYIPRDSIAQYSRYFTPSQLATPKARAIREYVYGALIQKDKPFIDFEVRTLESKPFKLSSLKGKYVLLSFWDAGCVPCRKENKHVSKEITRFVNKLEFVSFSLDKNKEAWSKASKADHITWYNVSDNLGIGSTVKAKYDVQAVPATFLINPDGIVQEIFVGFDDQFLDRLEKLITKKL